MFRGLPRLTVKAKAERQEKWETSPKRRTLGLIHIASSAGQLKEEGSVNPVKVKVKAGSRRL